MIVPNVHKAPAKPNIPPDSTTCSSYRDGTGAGDVLFHICNNAPDNEWSNCVRGKLLQQFTPNDDPLDLVFRYGLADHLKDFASCAVE